MTFAICTSFIKYFFHNIIIIVFNDLLIFNDNLYKVHQQIHLIKSLQVFLEKLFPQNKFLINKNIKERLETLEGLYLFADESDFINAIAELETHYQSKSNIIYLDKILNGISEIKREMELLDNFDLINFTGFYSSKQIKVVVADCFKYNYCINYCVIDKSRQYYDMFNRYLHKRQNMI